MARPKSRKTESRPYHHGDLRRTILAAAVAALQESGPSNVSLRDLARRAGVSHAAPAHHFGDKAGLLTAVATEGYQLLATELSAAQTQTQSLLEMGVAYVRFAVSHRAHFEVMYRPDLYNRDDPELVSARERTGEILSAGVALLPPSAASSNAELDSVAAWSLVHGFATLWLNNALPAGLGANLEAEARAVAGVLFRGAPE